MIYDAAGSDSAWGGVLERVRIESAQTFKQPSKPSSSCMSVVLGHKKVSSSVQYEVGMVGDPAMI